VIDPCGGIEDLDKRIIRMASSESIADDGIRMFRAYRFAATLDFTIHDETFAAIRSSAPTSASVAIERIRDELFKTLSASSSVHHLRAMDDVGLLEQVFPEIAKMRGMEQNDYHHLDVWEHSTLTLELFEQNPVPDSLEGYSSKIEDYLKYESVKGRTRISLLKLAMLLHDVGKPSVKTIDAGGRIRFFDHNREGAEIIEGIAKRLKLATREVLSLVAMVENHMYPLGLSVFLRKQRSAKSKTRAMRRFLQRAGDEWMAILLLSFADLRATQGPRRRADDLEMLANLMHEIAHMYSQKSHPPMPKLVTGSELMREFDLSASPVIGQLLKRVKKAQIDGIIETRDDAMKMVRDLLAK
jgi:poly(A) polymerase